MGPRAGAPPAASGEQRAKSSLLDHRDYSEKLLFRLDPDCSDLSVLQQRVVGIDGLQGTGSSEWGVGATQALYCASRPPDTIKAKADFS